jgi:hypothetical protein
MRISYLDDDEDLLPALDEDDELPRIGRPAHQRIQPELRDSMGNPSQTEATSWWRRGAANHGGKWWERETSPAALSEGGVRAEETERPAQEAVNLDVAGASAAMNPIDGVAEKLKAARGRLVTEVQGKPTAPNPKWWQKVAAAGLGAAAGYSNASGRGRPIDVSGAAGAIMGAPQHQRKLSDWLDRVSAANAEVGAGESDLATALKVRGADTEDALRSAQAGQARSTAKYNEHRADTERNRFKDTKAGVLDTQTGQIVQAPQSDIAKLNERDAHAKRQGWTERTHPGVTAWVAEGKWGASSGDPFKRAAAQIAFDDSISPEERKAKLDQVRDAYNAVNPEKPITGFETDEQGNVTVVAVNPREVMQSGGRKGLGRIGSPKHGNQPAPPTQFRLVEQNKSRAFTKAREQWNKERQEIERIYPATVSPSQDPEDVERAAAVNAERETALRSTDDRYREAQRAALDAYNNGLSAIGGEPTVFDIDWPENQSSAPASRGGRGAAGGARSGAAREFPRAKLDGFARANGITPAEAERRLKSEGYTIR